MLEGNVCANLGLEYIYNRLGLPEHHQPHGPPQPLLVPVPHPPARGTGGRELYVLGRLAL